MDMKFNFFELKNVADAIKIFSDADINTNPFCLGVEGDCFFGKVIKPPSERQPFELLSDYESFLELLYTANPTKFKKIHKGNPYYQMCWLCFYLHSYEKAIFYMDTAISEDIRKTIVDHKNENPSETKSDELLSEELLDRWIKNPSGEFFTLSITDVAFTKIITQKVRTAWQAQIDRFNKDTSNTLTLDDFIKKFITKLAEKLESRSIITALFTFILEYDDIKTMLRLRSSNSGSIEPILTYLFKGGLIFESLLKYKYKLTDNGHRIATLGGMTKNTNFRTTYNITNLNTSADTLETVVYNLSVNTAIINNQLQTSFDTVAQIRNTTGHNLQWKDIFNDETNFEKLFHQIINAYLFIYLNDYN